jgi:hypothetical protein
MKLTLYSNVLIKIHDKFHNDFKKESHIHNYNKKKLNPFEPQKSFT